MAEGAQAAREQGAKMMTLKAQQDELREGRIMGYACTRCDVRRLSPMVVCPNGHDAVRIQQFAATGVVETYTIQHISSEAFMNEVPFAWAIIRLDDGGPRVSGWIPFVGKEADLPLASRVRYTPSYKPGMMFEKA